MTEVKKDSFDKWEQEKTIQRPGNGQMKHSSQSWFIRIIFKKKIVQSIHVPWY